MYSSVIKLGILPPFELYWCIGGNSNHPCMGFPDQKDVDLAADLIIGEKGGSEELPRMGFVDQKDETLVPDFKIGGYLTNGDVGCVSRTLSAADEYYKSLQELHAQEQQIQEQQPPSEGLRSASNDDVPLTRLKKKRAATSSKEDSCQGTPIKLRRKVASLQIQSQPKGKSPTRKSKKPRNDVSANENEAKMSVAKKQRSKYDGSQKLTRHAPNLLANVIKRLSPEQRKWVIATGLGSLLHFDMQQFEHKLGFLLISMYNAADAEIKFRCGTIPVHEEDVEQILGLPRGKSAVVLAAKGESTDREDLFRDQFPNVAKKSDIGLIHLCDKIMGMEVASEVFKLLFLVIVNNLLIQKNANMYASQIFLRFTGNIDGLKNYNFCAYLLNALKTTKMQWAKSPEKKNFKGPLAFLILLYVELTYLTGLPPARSHLTTLQQWTEAALTTRFGAELQRGKEYGEDIKIIKSTPIVSKKRKLQKMIMAQDHIEVEQQQEESQEILFVSTLEAKPLLENMKH